ncbi:hypothetical protein ElyMa_000007000 [Elysia marginata]|uniref:RGS domain-containing protein n=1 Tax=Elysia marginata TaxID=1093978 RepID=A0AAV4EB98_9GAST|nr:hypothetical protein ElyMa_000007000 [Elysia marginata]
MLHVEEDEEVIVLSDGSSTDNAEETFLRPYGRILDCSNRSRLSFCQPSSSNENPKRRNALFSSEELPDLIAASCNEDSANLPASCRQKYPQPTERAQQEAVTLKPLRIVVVRCDEKGPGPLRKDFRVQEHTKLEPGLEKNNSGTTKNKPAVKRNACCDSGSVDKRAKYKDDEDDKGKLEKNEIAFESGFTDLTLSSNYLVSTRKRILAERQAVSFPLEQKHSLAIFQQPSPTRKNLPPSRISYHRQAFSSPFKFVGSVRLNKGESPHMKSSGNRVFPISTVDNVDLTENVVQIFHRTIKRKTEFDFYTQELSSQAFLNQRMNLERNMIFGRYWHVYVTQLQYEKSKKYFTEYHEAFIEAALDQEEDSVGEALSLLKDFQSKRCPTPESISSIIKAWKANDTLYKEQDANVVCVLKQIFESYPEVAQAYVNRNLMIFFSKHNFHYPEGSLLMASLELDFFTRTLCDSFSFRRSLTYSFLSMHKNRETIKGIIQLIKLNIIAYVGASRKNLLELETGKHKYSAFGKISCDMFSNKFLSTQILEFGKMTTDNTKKAHKVENVEGIKNPEINETSEEIKQKTLCKENLPAYFGSTQSSGEFFNQTAETFGPQSPAVRLNDDGGSCKEGKADSDARDNFLSPKNKVEGCRKGDLTNLNVKTALIAKDSPVPLISKTPDINEGGTWSITTTSPETIPKIDSPTRIPILNKMAHEFTQFYPNTGISNRSAKYENDETKKRNWNTGDTLEGMKRMSSMPNKENLYFQSKDTYPIQRVSPPLMPHDIDNPKGQEILQAVQVESDLQSDSQPDRDTRESYTDTLELIDQLSSLSASTMTNIFLYQRLLALSVECSSVSDKVTHLPNNSFCFITGVLLLL